MQNPLRGRIRRCGSKRCCSVVGSRGVEIRVVQGDLLEVDADVLAVKHAQGFHSSDGLVASRLEAKGVSRRTFEAEANEGRFSPTQGALVAREVLFVGTVP